MKKYYCPHCAAELYWDAKANALKCDYCDNQYQPAELDALLAKDDMAKGKKEEKPAPDRTEKETREITDQDRVSDDSSKTDTSDLVVYACENCGAEVITSKSTVATTCAFCGRAISLTNKMVGNFRPDCVIPFSVTEDEAKGIYRKYSKKGGLTPGAFKSESTIKKIKGVYVPFWLHSYTETANVLISAENVRSHKRGDDKIVDHDMYNVHMKVASDFESIPTDGLKNLDDSLMSAIEPFDYEKLSAFNAAYMAGFYAEEYDENAELKIREAQERSKFAMQADSRAEAGPYEEKTVASYSPTYSNVKSKYAMLPVWLFNVDYKGKLYQFAVNGETGKIGGRLPVSKAKVAAAIGGSFLGTQIIAAIFRLITM